PVSVTGTLLPAAPWAGAIAVTVGAAATVKPPVRVPLRPPGFVTVTSRAPSVAPAAIASVAVSWVAEGTATALTVMPAPTLNVATPGKLRAGIETRPRLPAGPCV